MTMFLPGQEIIVPEGTGVVLQADFREGGMVELFLRRTGTNDLLYHLRTSAEANPNETMKEIVDGLWFKRNDEEKNRE